MSKRTQPKRQRLPKIPAALKKAARNAVRMFNADGTATFKLSDFGPRGAGEGEVYEVSQEPVRKVLSWGGSYGWAGRHPADLSFLLKQAVVNFGKLRENIKIDAIAYTGSSGAAIAFPLAIAYDLPIIYVRKKGEQSHGGEVECNYTDEIETYMVVDDFISSGRTVGRVMEGVKKAAQRRGWEGPKCLGVFEFDPMSPTRERFDLRDDDYELTGVVVDVYHLNHLEKKDEGTQ
jgi:hypothetical protein